MTVQGNTRLVSYGIQTERSDLRAADARRILKDPSLPLETRLRVLVALQSMRPKAAVPLLQGLLADPSEDIRLLAYSMVDAWEKDVTRQIQQARLRLAEAEQALTDALRQRQFPAALAAAQQGLATAPDDPALLGLTAQLPGQLSALRQAGGAQRVALAEQAT